MPADPRGPTHGRTKGLAGSSGLRPSRFRHSAAFVGLPEASYSLTTRSAASVRRVYAWAGIFASRAFMPS
jgi:hypothetical protein